MIGSWWLRGSLTATNPGSGLVEKVGQPAYAVVNLAEYAVTEQVSAQLNVNKGFDEAYFSNNAWFAADIYGEPRNARLTLQYAF